MLLWFLPGASLLLGAVLVAAALRRLGAESRTLSAVASSGTCAEAMARSLRASGALRSRLARAEDRTAT